MRALLPTLASVALLAGVGALPADPAQTDARVVARHVAALDTVTLHVEGMTCGGCTLATRKVLERLDGVTKADVSYAEKRAVVTYDAKKVTVAQMIAAVATLEYTATVVRPAATPAPAAKP